MGRRRSDSSLRPRSRATYPLAAPLRYTPLSLYELNNGAFHQLSEFVGSHGSSRTSQPGDLVVFCRWSGSCNRAGRDFSSRRLAKGARIRQADSVRAAFLRGSNRGLRHRTFHGDAGHHVDHAGVDSVASVLGVLRRYLLYRSRTEPGDGDSGASLDEFARLDLFPFLSAGARPELGTASGESVWA